MKEAGDVDEEGGKGVGFGGLVGNILATGQDEVRDTMRGYVGDKGGIEGGNPKLEKLAKGRKRSRSRDQRREHRRRSRSLDRGRRHRPRHHDRDEGLGHRRHRPRSRSRDRRPRHSSRSRSRDRRRHDDRYPNQRRERSNSPRHRWRHSRERVHERRR